MKNYTYNDVTQNSNEAANNNYYNYPSNNTSQNPPIEDKVSVGFCILGWFIPLFALFYFLKKKQEKPKRAKAVGIVGLVSFILNIIVVIASFAFIGSTLKTLDTVDNIKDSNIMEEYQDDWDSFVSSYGDQCYDKNPDETNTFEFGTIKNDIYSNDFADLHIALPSEDWTFLTSEEIANDYLGNGSLDTVNDKVYLENDSEKSYFDMVMYNTVTNENIQVQLMQGLTYTHKNSSAQDLLDSLLSQVDSQYSSMGYTVTDKTEYGQKVSIGVNEFSVASIDIDLAGNGKTGQMYAITKIGGDTFVVITISGSESDVKLTELLKQFY